MNVSTRQRQSWLLAAVCLLAGVGLFHFGGNAARGYFPTRSLFSWWGRQWFDPGAEAEQGPLVVLVAGWLFWKNLNTAKTLRGKLPPPGTNSGSFGFGVFVLSVLGFSIGLHALGYAMQQTRVSVLALLLFLWGVICVGGGRRWGRAAVFPLGFLLLAVPVSFLQSIGFYLRLAVTQSAELIMRLVLGYGVVRSGTQLFSLDGRYQYDVAVACSGIRSLVALVALSCLIGYIRLPRFWPRALLVFATVPFAFAGNLARILAIALAGQWFGQSAGERVHAYSGFVTWVVVLGLLLVATRILEKRFAVTESVDAKPNASGAGASEASALATAEGAGRAPAALAATATVLVAVLAAGFAIRWIDSRPPEVDAGVRLAANGIDPAPLPEFIGDEWIGQRVDVTQPERDVLPPDTGYSRRNYVAISDRSRQVFVSIVLSGRDRSSIHRPELCVVGQGWNILSRDEHQLRVEPGKSIPVTLLKIQRQVTPRPGHTVIFTCWLAYWFVGRDAQVPSHTAMMWRSSLDRLLHFRADRWAYVVVQTPILSGDGKDFERMEEVLGAVWPAVKRDAAK